MAKTRKTPDSAEAEERAYRAGERAVALTLLRQAAQLLGYSTAEGQLAVRLAERELAISALRQLCADHGDNDWPDDLHLYDIIDKHLGRYLSGGRDE